MIMIYLKKTESIFHKLSYNENPRFKEFLREFFQTPKEDILSVSYKHFQKAKYKGPMSS